MPNMATIAGGCINVVTKSGIYSDYQGTRLKQGVDTGLIQCFGPASVNGEITSSAFGQVVSADAPRLVQLGAKLFSESIPAASWRTSSGSRVARWRPLKVHDQCADCRMRARRVAGPCKSWAASN